MRILTTLFFVASFFPTMLHAQSTTYDGITFPQGDSSFADSVVSYDPLFGGGPVPTNPNFTDQSAAIGPPDYTGGSNGTGSVALGEGGRIVLRFEDNALTGSNDDSEDLQIFEVGLFVQATLVDISVDGINFLSVGEVSGATSSIDIDPFLSAANIAPSTQFFFVRLTDNIPTGSDPGNTTGADIDSVGAVSSVSVPELSLIQSPSPRDQRGSRMPSSA